MSEVVTMMRYINRRILYFTVYFTSPAPFSAKFNNICIIGCSVSYQINKTVQVQLLGIYLHDSVSYELHSSRAQLSLDLAGGRAAARLEF